jgi:serine/threonine protein kinase
MTTMGSVSMQAHGGSESDIEARRMYARVTERLFGGPSAPVKIGRYRVLERRGEGAMGVVYAAVDERLGRKLAIKLLHPHFAGDPTGRARLLREAQAMARLRHDNVVLIYDVGTHGADEEQVFIAMELVEGCNLDAWLKQAPRSLEERLAVFLQAGRALAAAHRAGVLHRDFKPENVLVDAGGRARVLDFGLARALAAPAAGDPEDSLSEPLTRTGSILGTPAYMAPEQLRGDPVDARADQFSFCVALYDALYGERPFAAVQRFQPLRIAHVPKDSRVPGAVRRALLRGLARIRPRASRTWTRCSPPCARRSPDDAAGSPGCRSSRGPGSAPGWPQRRVSRARGRTWTSAAGRGLSPRRSSSSTASAAPSSPSAAAATAAAPPGSTACSRRIPRSPRCCCKRSAPTRTSRTCAARCSSSR